MASLRELVETVKDGSADELTSALRNSDSLAELFAAKFDFVPTNHAIGRGATLLQLAAFRNWKAGDATALALLELGAPLDVHSAAGLGLVEELTKHLKEDPEKRNKQVDSYFPLQFAITGSRPNSVRCLLEHGGDPNRELRKVAYFGWEDEVAEQDYLPWRPIHMACLWGFNESRIPVVEALLDGGADLEATCPLDGFRPLHLATMPNRVEMMRFLVERGADVDSRSEKCKTFKTSEENAGSITGHACTPLMVACGEGWVEATKCLLELGADTTAQNDLGQTPLYFAEKKFWDGQPYDEILKLLRDHGVE